MTSNNLRSRPKKAIRVKQAGWIEAKARIILRHDTVRAFARLVGCHPNSIRNAIEGRSPQIRRRIQEIFPL